jgi:hypothetical protein
MCEEQLTILTRNMRKWRKIKKFPFLILNIFAHGAEAPTQHYMVRLGKIVDRGATIIRAQQRFVSLLIISSILRFPCFSY